LRAASFELDPFSVALDFEGREAFGRFVGEGELRGGCVEEMCRDGDGVWVAGVDLELERRGAQGWWWSFGVRTRAREREREEGEALQTRPRFDDQRNASTSTGGEPPTGSVWPTTNVSIVVSSPASRIRMRAKC